MHCEFFHIAGGRQLEMNFSQGKKIGVCLTGKKKGIDSYIIIFSVSTLFLSSLLSAAFLLDSPAYSLKVILFSVLLLYVLPTYNRSLLGVFFFR